MAELNKVSTTSPRVEYYEMGRGPAVVLLHGGQCGADDWSNITPRLSQNYRLVLPDGLVVPLDPWNVWLLLDRLGIRNVALVGHSAGGRIAREMYRLQPDRVWAMICIDTNAAGDLILARKIPNDRFSPEAAAMYEQNRAAMEKLRPHHQGDYPSSTTLSRRMMAYRREIMQPHERASTRTWPAPLVCEVGAVASPTPIPMDGKFITCPTLVIHTGRGKIGPEDVPRDWSEKSSLAKDVEYVVLKEAGHWPWLEHPEWFLARLESFLIRAAKKVGTQEP